MITRLKLSTIEQGLPKYRSMLAGNDAFIPTSFESIASATGTGSSATITFSNIPGTYQHLQIRYLAKTTFATNSQYELNIQVNSDTNSNYNSHFLYGLNGTVTAGNNSGAQINSGDSPIPSSASAQANMMGVGIIDIHDYASTTKNKTFRSILGVDLNSTSTGRIILQSGLWRSTNAITSISLNVGAGNWTTTSTFALYGVKGA